LREIDPPYRIRREEYEARLPAIGFDADERVEGVAGVFYTFFFELDLDTLDGGE
jgi:hypothetical protein